MAHLDMEDHHLAVGINNNPGKGPASTVGPDGEVHINITGGMEKDPPGKHHGNGWLR